MGKTKEDLSVMLPRVWPAESLLVKAVCDSLPPCPLLVGHTGPIHP